MKTINIEQLPTLDNILTGDIIEHFRKTITDVMRVTNSNAEHIIKDMLFTLTILEDIREEYSDVMEKEF